MRHLLGLALLSLRSDAAILPGSTSGLLIAKQRRDFAKVEFQKLQPATAKDFIFRRFQSRDAVKKAFDGCRSRTSFKRYLGKDGRKGTVCSTKLGGDWVLAESEQVAPSCTCEQVLRTYLDPKHNNRWNADKVADVKLSRTRSQEGLPIYQQDLILKSIRVLRSKTGPMRYSQTITIDKIGSDAYCAFVELDPAQASSTRKPFESLSVYVGMQQQGEDVHIYAAGVMEVNRKVVPNLIVFDASGIAGDQAGKGTLWLAGHFEEKQQEDRRAAARRAPWPARARRFVETTRSRLLQPVHA